jgi:outer membrane receptor protein involved in Fe transport
VRLFPDAYDPTNYPVGLTEILKTHTTDVFSRIQLSYDLGNKSVLLGGIENSVFLYDGDALHISNVDLNYFNDTYAATPDNGFIEVGDYFQWLNTHPMLNTGIYLQYTSPKWGNMFQLTAGLRYDNSSFKYNDIFVENAKDEKKSFDKVSPRLSLIFSATDNLTFKLMGGQAFRTPAPSELFGSNTYLLGSNIGELKPEVITTIELASDWKISKNWIWRLNGFYTQFDDQIAYSEANFNLSTNVYSLNTMGIETELIFKYSNFEGFFNYSYAQRTDEEIVDENIEISKSKLTWVPQSIANVGVIYKIGNLNVSLQAHYQGAVNRRSSDSNSSRADKVDSWLTADARAAYKFGRNIELGLIGNNIFNEKGYLLKTGAYPFDYRIPQARVMIDLRLMF